MTRKKQHEKFAEDYMKSDGVESLAYMVKGEPSWKLMGNESNISKAARTANKNKIDHSGINGELDNIAKGVSPFEAVSGGIGVTDAIVLCQKAYWNVAVFRSTIDVQTEFCNSKIKFSSENKTVENFFTAWDKQINGWAFRDQFFREWFRSGNVFTFRFDRDLEYSQYRKMSRNDAAAKLESVTKKIPLRYIILNPADMKCLGGVSFVNAEYGKLLSDYEVKRLKARQTPEEKEFYDTLDPESQKAINSGSRPIIRLSPDKLKGIFCAKQDYEPMSVPMYYPVLCDINLKLEFKKAEQVIARTVDYAVLLMTCGAEDRDPIDNNNIRLAITELFSSESVGRVLVSDYTTKGEFIIPDLNKIFGSEKYKVVNDDIANGLMNIFWSSEKFANALIKIQVFLERLNQARESYINGFLKPEMKRIADELGFTTIPEVTFEEANLRDDLELKKLYVHMAEIGALTVEETLEAIKTGLLPTNTDSIESQERFKKLKDKKLYVPLLNQGKDEPTQPAGRKSGTKVPTQKKKVGPIGGSFSVSKIRDSIRLINNISSIVESGYKKKYNIQRLSKKHKDLAWHIAESIFINEPKEKWEESIAEYLVSPKPLGPETDTILELSEEHGVSPLVGVILRHSSQDSVSQDEVTSVNDNE